MLEISFFKGAWPAVLCERSDCVCNVLGTVDISKV